MGGWMGGRKCAGGWGEQVERESGGRVERESGVRLEGGGKGGKGGKNGGGWVDGYEDVCG